MELGMERSFFIGVDIGTTSTKVIAFSSSGAIKHSVSHGYSLFSPQPGWSEEDPEAIFAAVITGLQEVMIQGGLAAEDIAAVGFSAAMHTLIVMDQHHSRLTNSMTWADSRSIKQAERLKQDKRGFDLYQRTGTPIHPMSPLAKIIWLREQDTETFHNAAKFISIKEYIFYQLFDRYLVDYSIASATGLLNLQRLTWDDEALAWAGIRADQLSDLVPTTHILRGLRPQYAEATGLHPDTPIVIGASDGVLANLGVGAISPEQIAVTIGTSGAVRKVVSAPLTDPHGRTFCYALTDRHWIVGGATNSGGIVLRWFRDQFGSAEIEQAQATGTDPYDLLIEHAQTVRAGAEGVIFLPFLTGERAPYWNADARGVFFGVALHHERSHVIRALLEGILFSVYSVTAVLDELTGRSQTVSASGGFARSQVWRQMMADVFNYPVLAPEVYEASGFGAAVMAMVAVGALADLADVQPLIRIHDRHQPHPALSRQYQQLFAVYQQVYANLVEPFSTIAAYQRQTET